MKPADRPPLLFKEGDTVFVRHSASITYIGEIVWVSAKDWQRYVIRMVRAIQSPKPYRFAHQYSEHESRVEALSPDMVATFLAQ